MSDDLDLLVGSLGDQMLARLQSNLGEDWKGLTGEARDEIQACLQDLSKLTFEGLAGVNLERELQHVRAQIAQWEFVGADRVKGAVAEVLKEALQFVLGVLAAAVLAA